MPATIDPSPGGAFNTFGGLVEGRNVELIPNRRIVQAWRPTHWDPGVYSIVHFELKAASSGTALVLDHTGFPEGEFDHLDPGWNMRYWDPLKKYLATPE
jgi:activator of HSP90 ATPase